MRGLSVAAGLACFSPDIAFAEWPSTARLCAPDRSGVPRAQLGLYHDLRWLIERCSIGVTDQIPVEMINTKNRGKHDGVFEHQYRRLYTSQTQVQELKYDQPQ